ncbi:hypothetical protein K3495_g14674 [Podosphaera aphanis]|nr:hypothetical protein K3495_g14674 [Podosphaera aphanis]
MPITVMTGSPNKPCSSGYATRVSAGITRGTHVGLVKAGTSSFQPGPAEEGDYRAYDRLHAMHNDCYLTFIEWQVTNGVCCDDIDTIARADGKGTRQQGSDAVYDVDIDNITGAGE